MFGDFSFFDVVTIKVENNNLKYTFIIPGVSKDNINISVTNTNLSVKTTEKTAFGEKFVYSDNWKYGKNFKIDETKASFENGVLTITIPKKEPAKEEINYIKID